MLICWLFFPEDGLSQEKITASAPSKVIVNKAFNYTVSAESQGKVSLNPPEGIRILSGPSQMVSYQSSNINGKMTTTTQVSYTFLLIASKEGTISLPPAVLRVNKKELKSNPVNIEVIAQGKTESANSRSSTGRDEEAAPVIVKLIPSRTELYEGEQLVISTKIYVRVRNEIHSLNSPGYEGFWVENLDPDQMAGNDVLNGYNYNSQVVKRELLTAQKKGEVIIDPVSLDVTILNRISRRRSVFDSFFDDPFSDNYQRDRRMLKSNSPVIKIKELPAGKPDGFRGGVGNFKVSSFIKSEDSITTNNALSLIIQIQGSGNLPLLNAPEVNFPPDLEVFDPKRTENVNHGSGGTTGSVHFEYVIIPRHPGNYRIPAVNYAFFNPSSGKYVTYSSDVFSFSVHGESFDAGIQGSGNSFFREDVKNLSSDIQYIKTKPGVFVQEGEYLLSQNFVWLYYVTGIALLLLFMVFWRNKLKKESDIFYVRNKKASQYARKRLKNAFKLLNQENDAFYDEVLKAMWGYLADRLGINTADLSRDNINSGMNSRGIAEDIRKDFWEIIDQCEFARYSPNDNENRNEIYDKAKECLSRIERLI